jgi:hypothetical protein
VGRQDPLGLHEARRREVPPGPSRGPAVLDIGPGIGAAVVFTTAALDGAEIEVKRSEGQWDGAHTAVRRRVCSDPDTPPVYAALFDRLPSGRYELRIRGADPSRPILTIDVPGGSVAEFRFPA